MAWIDLPLLKFLLDIAGKLGGFLAGLLPKRHAKAKLADSGIAYSEESFFERVKRGDRGAVRLFMKAGMRADVEDKDERRPLSFALKREDAEMILILARAGANLNATAYGFERTALADEASSGHLRNMRSLLAAGAAVNARCAEGSTALMEAAYTGGADSVQLLIDAGADINAVNRRGESALMIAARFGRMKELQLLIRAGAEVNARDNRGATVLMRSEGRSQVASVLVEAGADVEARDNKGRSVREWFEICGCAPVETERIVQELRTLAGNRAVRPQNIPPGSRDTPGFWNRWLGWWRQH